VHYSLTLFNFQVYYSFNLQWKYKKYISYKTGATGKF